MEKNKLQQTALHILNSIGINATEEDLNKESIVSNTGETRPIDVHGTKVSAQVVIYEDGGCRVEVHFELPETACEANTYIDYCIKQEKIPRNEYGRPFAGNKARKALHKHTEAYSPWNNKFFVVDSMYYEAGEFDEAVQNAIALATPFVKCLSDVASLRYWTVKDAEVIKKAKEIIENAELEETDCDREEKAHYMRDTKSFFHGWFYPFNDRGNGTFDTLWPSSVDYAAGAMGNKGEFNFAVASILLEDETFIAKARKACRIRKQTITVEY